MKLSKKKMITFAAGVLALVMVVGTWAYFSSTSAIDNQAQTLAYGTKTFEEFTPKQDMEPGAKITKAVNVSNTGDYDLVVRIKMDEKWTRPNPNVPTQNDTFKEIAFDGPIDTVAYASGPPEAWTATQVDATDGVVPTTDNEQTVVFKELNVGATDNWVKGTDGYYYYKTKLTGKTTTTSTTSNLLDSIRLASNADLGEYVPTQYWSIADKTFIEGKIAAGTITEADYDWKTTKPADESTITFIKSETELVAGKEGYANADYTLTITTEVLQATTEAIDATWAMTATDLAAIRAAWGL